MVSLTKSFGLFVRLLYALKVFHCRIGDSHPIHTISFVSFGVSDFSYSKPAVVFSPLRSLHLLEPGVSEVMADLTVSGAEECFFWQVVRSVLSGVYGVGCGCAVPDSTSQIPRTTLPV